MTVVIQRLHFLDVTLSSLVAGGGGGGAVPILRKISTHFPYFHLLTPPLIFHLPLFITTPPCHPFNQSHLLLEK